MGFPAGSGVKNLPTMQETKARSLGGKDPLEEGMASHSSILAWRIPWTEEPGGLQSEGSQSQTRLKRLSSNNTGTCMHGLPCWFKTIIIIINYNLLYNTGNFAQCMWKPGWERVWGRTDTSICMVESFGCPYTPTQNKKINLKKKEERMAIYRSHMKSHTYLSTPFYAILYLPHLLFPYTWFNVATPFLLFWTLMSTISDSINSIFLSRPQKFQDLLTERNQQFYLGRTTLNWSHYRPFYWLKDS